MQPTRVLILFNEPVLPPEHADFESEHEVLETVAMVSDHLRDAGYLPERLGIDNAASLIDGLKSLHPDVVFNLFEGTGDQSNNEATVAGLLEWLHVPFTGSPFQTLSLAHSKHLVKHILRDTGVQTPDFFVADSLPITNIPVKWPVIVKPAQEHASVGLDQGSVVSDLKELNVRVGQLLERYRPPVLVEQFIRGRELNVALVEAPALKALPISEIFFLNQDPAYWPIVTYDAKWNPGSRECEETPPRCPADVSPELSARLEVMARNAFQLLGCRDYARFDFRVSASGEPYLLEANPNPGYHPTAGFARSLAAAGIPHAAFTVQLVRNAFVRAANLRLPSRGSAGVVSWR